MEHGPWRAVRLLGPVIGGLALWAAAGAQAFADQSESADRLGVLPHPGWVIPGVLLVAWIAWRVERRGRNAHVVLLAGGLALLPWLPLRVPALFIWTPLVLAMVVVVVATILVGRAFLTAGPSDRWRRPASGGAPCSRPH